jgi:MFS transporter, ACS family, solute carrier family 17 (sodium-dependent inorganic phosphate cotransporter), other
VNMLVPLVSDQPAWVMLVRLLCGACNGPMWPAIVDILSKWVPPTERSLALNTVFNGNPVATIVVFFLSPYIIEGLGWRWVLWLDGFVGLLWSLLWVLFVSRSPEHSLRSRVGPARISRAELQYIRTGLSVRSFLLFR